MEIYKSVKGYEGIYEVSNFGNVRSIDRNDSIGRKTKGRIISPSVCNGYLGVNLCKNSKATYTKVHKIVAETFLEKTENRNEVNHKNGNKKDNRLENLEYVTKSENIRHRVIERLHETNLNKYSDLEIAKIIDEYYKVAGTGKKGVKHLIKKYNLKENDIRHLVNRRSPVTQNVKKQSYENNIDCKTAFKFITEKRNKEIIDLKKHGFSITSISKVYGIDLAQVCRITINYKSNSENIKYTL